MFLFQLTVLAVELAIPLDRVGAQALLGIDAIVREDVLGAMCPCVFEHGDSASGAVVGGLIQKNKREEGARKKTK
jgi:hypothetical protein